MAQAISNKVFVHDDKYCWMICDYSISGSTLSYTLRFFFEGGDAQLDDAWIKVGDNTIWSNPGRVHNYDSTQDDRGNYQLDIHSGQTSISATQTVSFGLTVFRGKPVVGGFTVTGGSIPSGGSITNLSSTWNTITGTVSVLNWGGLSPKLLEFKVLKSPYAAYVPARQVQFFNYAGPGTGTVTNNSYTVFNPDWVIKGCGSYYTGLYAENDAGSYRLQGPTVYTPPAPSVLSYVEASGVSDKTYTVTFAGVPADNESTYDSNELSRTVRYRVGNGAWVYVNNAEHFLIGASTIFNITVPAGKVAVVEGWQTYQGIDSVVSSISIVNTNAPIGFYGSVNALSVKAIKFYGPVINGNNESVSKKVVKIYGSSGGVTKQVFEDV